MFEELIAFLKKELSRKTTSKQGKLDIFPLDSTIISMTSKLMWSLGFHQVKLFSEINLSTGEPGGIVIHFGQGHGYLEKYRFFWEWQRDLKGSSLLKAAKWQLIEVPTKGYNLEHNFGHGKQHLSSLRATLNILSLLFHTGLELLDQKYTLLRSHLPTRKTFFDDLRALTRYLYFDSWDHLLTFMLEGLELEIPPNTS